MAGPPRAAIDSGAPASQCPFGGQPALLDLILPCKGTQATCGPLPTVASLIERLSEALGTGCLRWVYVRSPPQEPGNEKGRVQIVTDAVVQHPCQAVPRPLWAARTSRPAPRVWVAGRLVVFD